MSAFIQAQRFLDAQKDGSFSELSHAVMREPGAISHISADAFLLAVPACDDRRTLLVVFACGDVGAVARVVSIYRGKFDFVAWQRVFKRGTEIWHTYTMERILRYAR